MPYPVRESEGLYALCELFHESGLPIDPPSRRTADPLRPCPKGRKGKNVSRGSMDQVRVLDEVQIRVSNPSGSVLVRTWKPDRLLVMANGIDQQ